ncbi:PE family protein PE3 [Mycobacterium simulans]|uniref:PE family protein PE3 n=1 Tax=Mycobacterium simulans TaxID=627089 RepID=A0A7Z7N9W5_9MYCO|nr:PE-PPE domain-containing protein [Mycobacterium simulans]SOJ54262.1 PE family protein PE3 [Mycobacterium simulans]
MTYVVAEPQMMAVLADDAERIGSAISAASAAAARLTSDLPAAAADEVSEAIAQLFGEYGQEYQAIATEVEAFHRQFHQALATAKNAYAQAEAANVVALQEALEAPIAPTQTPKAAGIPPFPANEVSLFPGVTGVPIPSKVQIDLANGLYVRSTGILQALFTPQEGYPWTGVKSLPFDKSVGLGTTIFENTIYDLIHNSGKSVTVVGGSQSAVIASQVMRDLASGSSIFGANPARADQLNFVLFGNEASPNGGMFSRFPNLSLPSLGLTFGGSTPADTIYPTAIYTLEYDGFASFPRYPLNIIADLNALAGIVYVHPTYLDLTPEQINNAIPLPTSPGYSGVTSYYMIRTENLPLLEPLRAIPVIGDPLANLVQPALKVIVNLGYGDPAHGFSTSYADVLTPFGLFPDVSLAEVADALGAGIRQGIHDFTNDLQAIFAQPFTLPSLSLPSFAMPSLDLGATLAAFPSPMTLVNTAASIISTDYAVLLPIADVAFSMITTVPVYLGQLFVEQLLQGSLINAIGYPLAAVVGLGSIAGGIELFTIANALISNISDIHTLIS